MNLYSQAFEEALDQNEINEDKWKLYKNEISQTRETLNTFIKSCQLEIMVPLGKKAFVRGKLQHTNDILMSHDYNYFSVLSNSQANEIMEKRSDTCDEKIKLFQKERELFRGKLDASRNEAFSENEIIEEYDEAAEAEWQKKHRESIRKQKLKELDERKCDKEQSVDDIFDRYEMLEEMANELDNLEISGDDSESMIAKLINGEIEIPKSKERISHGSVEQDIDNTQGIDIIDNSEVKEKVKKRKVRFSSSLEDIKIFDTKKEEVKNFTIEIKFNHSPNKFHQSEYAEEDKGMIYRNPSDINLHFKELVASKTKSILKDTNYNYKKSVNLKYKYDDSELEIEKLPISSFPIICSDEVIERKNIQPIKEFNDSKPRTISKFKQLRNKVII